MFIQWICRQNIQGVDLGCVDRGYVGKGCVGGGVSMADPTACAKNTCSQRRGLVS